VLTVAWPSTTDCNAQVWRILDLSGMTKSVRESKNFTRAGFVYLDGVRVSGFKTTVATGSLFVLEIRFPNGKIVSREIRLVTSTPPRQQRNPNPTNNYRG